MDGVGWATSYSDAPSAGDDLVRSYGVLPRLRVAERGGVDPSGDAVDEAPLQDTPLDGGDGVLRVRIEVEAEPAGLARPLLSRPAGARRRARASP